MSEDNNLEFSLDENVVPLKKVRKVRKVVRKVVAKVQDEEKDDNVVENFDEENNDKKEQNINKIQRPFDILYISQLSVLTFDELIDFAEN